MKGVPILIGIGLFLGSLAKAQSNSRFDGIWVGTETATEVGTWAPGKAPKSSSQVTIAVAQGGTLVGRIGGPCPGRFQNVRWKGDTLNFDVSHCKFSLRLSPDGKTLIEGGNVERAVGQRQATNIIVYEYFTISGTFRRQ